MYFNWISHTLVGENKQIHQDDYFITTSKDGDEEATEIICYQKMTLSTK